jgi:hypothetical protein
MSSLRNSTTEQVPGRICSMARDKEGIPAIQPEDSPTELRTTELRTTKLITIQLIMTQLRTTQLRKRPNL